MGTLKKDFKFKKINNFLTQEEVHLLGIYAKLFHVHNVDSFDFIQNKNGDTGKYSDYIMESLMLCKKDLVEKETNLKLIPTYSFWRCYTKFSDLEKHKDRPSCEVSVTCQIAGDGSDWPLYVDGESFLLKNGEALIYWGTEVDHWRDEFKGDHHVQAFLHYVDAEGPHKEYAVDNRVLYGEMKT